MATYVLVLLGSLCQGPASPAGTAYMACEPTVGELAYCPDDPEAEEAECIITAVSGPNHGTSIVHWEHAK